MDCKSFLFLVLVSFLLLFPGVDYFSSSQKEPQFEYFSLVLQWPNSFCHLHADKCNIYPVPRDFTIHGLWPDNVTVELRDCITAPIFDPTILTIELKTKLNEYWPDLTNSNPKALSLVESQWHKHGRCAYPYYSQVAYLWKAVDLRLTANVLEFLKEDNISPDDNRFVALIPVRGIFINPVPTGLKLLKVPKKKNVS
ncbi:hypothetical protein ACJIZ3_014241 [Penstemon smallii]|uniref:Uncharacterized protein n=1 Tax=Penstemon smallii TaxID=265156 RepID=A0ABD3RJ24_9LAMI